MLVCRDIAKSYPGVKSLDGVDLLVSRGEIHALLGENGAGKSTLVRIISGATQPDQGSLMLDGRPVAWSTAKEARDAGIHVVHQELALFAEMSVAENIFLGEEPRTLFGTIDMAQMKRRAEAILRDFGVAIDANARVDDLSIADQQVVEIAKAFVGSVKLLILDEPTAVISGREAELLFERLRVLREQGVAIIYISHRLEEVFELADRATILKDGRLVGTVQLDAIDRPGLIRMMVGRELQDLYPPKNGTSDGQTIVLDVRDIGDDRVGNVSFSLHAGEVLGIAGMIGSGRTELMELIFGSRRLRSGTVTLDGEKIAKHSPKLLIQKGVGFLTEDRKREGLMLNLSVAVNITVAQLEAGLRALDLKKERQIAATEIATYSIAGAQPQTSVVNLSGGNQQKVLFARWMRTSNRVLILDEPTRGVDVGAKAEIYRLIRECAGKGIGILLVSSELPEIIGLSDRVLVMRAGEITGELSGASITEEAILDLATASRRE